MVILFPFIPPLFSFSLLSFELLLWIYFILKSSHQDEAAFQLWSQQHWRTGITVRALHKAVLFTDTGILVLPAVQCCWIVFSVTHCNLSSLFLHSCFSGTRLKVIDKTRVFLNLQSIPDFEDEIPLPWRNVAVSGSLGELLPYLKGRALLSTRGSSKPAPGLPCWAFLCMVSPFFGFSVWSVSSLCRVNVESVLVCFSVCRWFL